MKRTSDPDYQKILEKHGFEPTSDEDREDATEAIPFLMEIGD